LKAGGRRVAKGWECKTKGIGGGGVQVAAAGTVAVDSDGAWPLCDWGGVIKLKHFI
jgi:hypothetical protein